MRAKTDVATDVWMTEAADAAPGFWAHCWCRAFQLSFTNALWEFKGILIFRSPADDLVWTSNINSSRETAFKRSQTRWWSIKQQFSIETEELMKRYSWMIETMCVCTAFLGWNHLPPPVICNLLTFVPEAASPAVGSTAASGHCCFCNFPITWWKTRFIIY